MIKNNWIYVQFVVLIIRSCQNKSTLSERFTVIDFWLFSEILAKCRELNWVTQNCHVFFSV